MSRQLDILALEPFFGGGRRNMLETLIHYSRHRWTLLKLPPRRIERRLTAAAHWFAEQLTRHWVGRVDLLFTSEALNLADLYRLMPNLLKKPSVVYFHSNQLPHPSVQSDNPLDMANMNTGAAATEIWFNSLYHLRDFLSRAAALVEARLSSGVFISTKDGCPADYRAVRACAAGCWPIVPGSGCYPELIPQRMHGRAMHDSSPSGLTSKLQDTWHLDQPSGYED